MKTKKKEFKKAKLYFRNDLYEMFVLEKDNSVSYFCNFRLSWQKSFLNRRFLQKKMNKKNSYFLGDIP